MFSAGPVVSTVVIVAGPASGVWFWRCGLRFKFVLL
jgi:hypothetical protein